MRNLKTWLVLWIITMGVMVSVLSAQPPKRDDASADDPSAAGGGDRDRPDDQSADRPGPGGPGGPGGRGQQPGPPPGGQFLDLALVKKTSPELYKAFMKERELEQSARKLARKYQQASDEKKEQLKKDLEKIVDEKFDAGQKRRELELAWRKSNKQQIIDKEITNLTSQDKGDRRGPPGRSDSGSSDSGRSDSDRPNMGPPPDSDDMPPRQ
jgi:hypothetical protein